MSRSLFVALGAALATPEIGQKLALTATIAADWQAGRLDWQDTTPVDLACGRPVRPELVPHRQVPLPLLLHQEDGLVHQRRVEDGVGLAEGVGHHRLQLGQLRAHVGVLAALAREPVPQEVLKAYGLQALEFGIDYVVPKPLDRRVCLWEAPAVAQAAMQSGVARKPLEIEEYRAVLEKRLLK